MFYRKNLPTWERVLRTAVGVATMAYGALALPAAPLGYLIMATGATAILTGFVGFCPMCAMVGRKLDNEK